MGISYGNLRKTVLAEITVVVFAGICNVFPEPVRRGEGVCFFYGIKLNLNDNKSFEIFLKDIKLGGQFIIKWNQITCLGD